mmetsp:Transcript_84385/g.220376  ORF Transcript_84385/g.220376 Transcript_84385/m.220376 type:complete len:217 (+) Transcript_84385:642-1292(+)
MPPISPTGLLYTIAWSHAKMPHRSFSCMASSFGSSLQGSMTVKQKRDAVSGRCFTRHREPFFSFDPVMGSITRWHQLSSSSKYSMPWQKSVREQAVLHSYTVMLLCIITGVESLSVRHAISSAPRRPWSTNGAGSCRRHVAPGVGVPPVMGHVSTRQLLLWCCTPVHAAVRAHRAWQSPSVVTSPWGGKAPSLALSSSGCVHICSTLPSTGSKAGL